MEEGLPSKEKNENTQLVFKQKMMDSRWQDYNFLYQLKISFKNKNWRLKNMQTITMCVSKA